MVPILRFVPDAAAELRFELAENVHQAVGVASLAAGRGILPRPPGPIRGGGCRGPRVGIGDGCGTAARTAAGSGRDAPPITSWERSDRRSNQHEAGA